MRGMFSTPAAVPRAIDENEKNGWKTTLLEDGKQESDNASSTQTVIDDAKAKELKVWVLCK